MEKTVAMVAEVAIKIGRERSRLGRNLCGTGALDVFSDFF